MSLLLLQKRREMMKQFAWNTVTGIGRVVLENGLNARLKALNLKGKTEQEKIEGKNLIDMYKIVDNEGYADSNFTRAVEINKFHVEEGKKYVLITKGSTNNFGSYSSVYFGENDLKYTVADTHVLDMNTGVKTINENKEIKMVVTAKKTCDITHCMIHGNAVAEKAYYVEEFGLFEYVNGNEEYEPYTGGKPSPNKEYPQKIVSAGRKSKNLFNKENIVTGVMINGDIGKVISIDSVSYTSCFCKLKVKQYTKYSWKLSSKNENTFRYKYVFTDEDGKITAFDYASGPNTERFMQNVDSADAQYLYIDIVDLEVGQVEVQVEEGEVCTDYEPYTEKYMIDIKLTGKNILNEEELYNSNNWNNYLYEVKLKPNTKYTFSRENNSGYQSGIFFSIQDTQEGTASQIINSNSSVMNRKQITFTTNATGIIKFKLSGYSANGLREFIGYVQLEEGNVATEYEQYKEQLVTLTSDRPITKFDRIVKKDGVWGIAYKHRAVDDFATLVKENEQIYGNTGDRYFTVSVNNTAFDYDYKKIYCEVGTYVKDVQTLYVPKVMQKSFLIHVKDEDTIATAKEQLHYNMIYETDLEEFVQLTEAEQIIMNNLHTEKGTTYITVNSGEVQAEIEATYKINRRKNE